jgi:hypothetical protein
MSPDGQESIHSSEATSSIQNSSYNKELCIRKGSIIVTICKIFLTYLIVFNYVRCVSPDIRVKEGAHPASRISGITKLAKDFTMQKKKSRKSPALK